MRKSKIAILALAPALLCGCAMKCDFAKFQEKVGAIDRKGVTTTKIVISGKLTIGDKEEDINYDSSTASLIDLVSPNAIAAAVMALNNVNFYAVAEDTNSTYYAGTTFKVTNDVLKIEWNKYGDCTKAKGKLDDGKGSNYSVNLSAKYTYETK